MLLFRTVGTALLCDCRRATMAEEGVLKDARHEYVASRIATSLKLKQEKTLKFVTGDDTK